MKRVAGPHHHLHGLAAGGLPGSRASFAGWRQVWVAGRRIEKAGRASRMPTRRRGIDRWVGLGRLDRFWKSGNSPSQNRQVTPNWNCRGGPALRRTMPLPAGPLWIWLLWVALLLYPERFSRSNRLNTSIRNTKKAPPQLEIPGRAEVGHVRPRQAVAVAAFAREAVAVAHVGVAEGAAVAVQVGGAVERPVRNAVDRLAALRQQGQAQLEGRQRGIFEVAVHHVLAVVHRRTPFGAEIIAVLGAEIDVVGIVAQPRPGVGHAVGKGPRAARLLERQGGRLVMRLARRFRDHDAARPARQRADRPGGVGFGRGAHHHATPGRSGTAPAR